VKNVSDSNKDYKVIGAILTVAGAITSWSLPIIGAFPGAVTLATGIAFLVKGLLPEKEGKSK
jgi:hypothetical protein